MTAKSYFPKVGVFASSQFAHFYGQAARALGVELIKLDSNEDLSQPNNQKNFAELVKDCQVITTLDVGPNLATIKSFERSGLKFAPNSAQIEETLEVETLGDLAGSGEINESVFVQVARSPHGQVATWAPAKIYRHQESAIDSVMVVAPAPDYSEEDLIAAQNEAIKIAGELGIVGIASLELLQRDGVWRVLNFQAAPSRFGLWTMHGAITSQFEQHLRAILDLPLGDTTLRSKWTASADIKSVNKQDMYRPYLHLMARNPAMKFWQGGEGNFMVISGSDLEFLKAEILHADSYFKGEIDE